jgi:hypothetical protein
MLTVLPAARLMTASLSQVASQDIGNSMPSWPDIAFMTLVFLIFALVVLPAVWGRNAELRDAAFRVLDRILRALMGR